MVDAKKLIYDGSFNGFLSAVFIAFEKNIEVNDIQKKSANQDGLFSDTKTIFTNLYKAKRVWNGIQAKSYTAIKNIYFAYQGETRGIELLLFQYIKKLYTPHDAFPSENSNTIELKIEQLAKNVSREKQHIEAFSRFQITDDEIYFINIEPNFDVLPLLSKHYRSKYNEQQWIIYDIKRNYGIYYDLEKVEIISLDLKNFYNSNDNSKVVTTQAAYSQLELFNNYFKYTAIKSLINKKLHQQPQRPTIKPQDLILKKEAV